MEMTYDYAPSKLLQLALLSHSIAPGRNYASVISAIDAKIAKREADGRPVYPFSTQELFQFVRLKQQCSQPYSLSVLSPFMAKTSAGNLYFTSYTDRESLARLPYSNDVALSLVGYDMRRLRTRAQSRCATASTSAWVSMAGAIPTFQPRCSGI